MRALLLRIIFAVIEKTTNKQTEQTPAEQAPTEQTPTEQTPTCCMLLPAAGCVCVLRRAAACCALFAAATFALLLPSCCCLCCCVPLRAAVPVFVLLRLRCGLLRSAHCVLRAAACRDSSCRVMLQSSGHAICAATRCPQSPGACYLEGLVWPRFQYAANPDSPESPTPMGLPSGYVP